MENKIYLDHYRLAFDELGLPFVIRRSAGEGTFRGQDIRSHETVAMQIIPVGPSRAAPRDQLKTSAQLAKKIEHRHLLAQKEFGFSGDQFVYVTEYFDGNTADDWVKQHGPLPVSAVLRIAAQIVSALAAASFHEVVHPALNPSNIMLVPGQTAEGDWPLIKVLNFVGLPPKFSRAQAAAAGVKDPVNFASPEQLEGGAVDFASEIYSLGCMLWFFLTGVPPLAGAATVANAKNVPASVRGLLATMLAVSPNERPRDPLILQGEIQECLAQLERRDGPSTTFGTPLSAAIAPLETARTRSKFVPTLALAALFVTMAVIAGLFLPDYLRGLRKPQTVGIPLEPPEASPPPAVANAEPSPMIETSPAAMPAGTEPQVLVSTANAADEKSEAEPSASPLTESAPSPAEVAANDVASAPTPEPSVEETPSVATNENPVASETNEPAPPAEGPKEETASVTTTPPEEVVSSAQGSAEAEQIVAAPTPVATPLPSPEEPTVAVAVETTPRPTAAPEKSAVAAKPPTHAVRRARLARTAAPSSNRGDVRPQFLGTTPDGSAVFGVPPTERGYPPPSEAERSSRRRPRPKATPAENLPVLPALPPDQ